MVRSTAGRLNAGVRGDAQRGIMSIALQILHRAWPATIRDPAVTIDAKEDSITDVLRRRMSDEKRSMPNPPAMRFEREAQSDASEDDTELGLIDIMVCYSWDERTYLVIECKRITSTHNTLALKYVRKGVNRFASGKYSAGHSFGAMVGYVLCGDQPACAGRIQNVLSSEPEADTGYDAAQGWNWSRDVIPGVDTATTRHTQAVANNTITLIHSFVDLPSRP